MNSIEANQPESLRPFGPPALNERCRKGHSERTREESGPGLQSQMFREYAALKVRAHGSGSHSLDFHLTTQSLQMTHQPVDL
ncbi:MAG: hypothetical protein ABSH20_26510, partial [Tepidisphaeraceae bacterium]